MENTMRYVFAIVWQVLLRKYLSFNGIKERTTSKQQWGSAASPAPATPHQPTLSILYFRFLGRNDLLMIGPVVP